MEDAAASEAAAQGLRTKLRSALKEGMILLESVQQLEADKALIEEKVILTHPNYFLCCHADVHLNQN
jgi:hypothetical protein